MHAYTSSKLIEKFLSHKPFLPSKFICMKSNIKASKTNSGQLCGPLIFHGTKLNKGK